MRDATRSATGGPGFEFARVREDARRRAAVPVLAAEADTRLTPRVSVVGPDRGADEIRAIRDVRDPRKPGTKPRAARYSPPLQSRFAVLDLGLREARSVAWLNCRVVVALRSLHGFVDRVEDVVLA